jgi:hypothetical protein
MKMRPPHIVVAACLLCLQSGRAETSPPAPVSKVQDGIIAALAISGDKGAIVWRFAHPIAAPLNSIAVSLNETPLRDEPVQPYPAPGDATAIMTILDIGGLQQRASVEAEKSAIIKVTQSISVFHRLALAVYAAEARLLQPADGKLGSLLGLFQSMTAIDQPSNLSKALMLSINTLAHLPASRRAIFVFSDGHNDGVTPLADIQALANAYGVVVNVVVFPSQRGADLNALKGLAENTGGRFVDQPALAEFLRAPFVALDSGGYRAIDLAVARRYFWEGPPALKAVFHYGEKQLELVTSFDPPPATAAETAQHVFDAYRLWLLAAIMVLVGLAVLAARVVRKLGLVNSPGATAPAAFAVLKDIGDGTTYALKRPRCTIGRSKDNDVVVADDTVSRLHAVLRQDEGQLRIENVSSNGTYVNHVAVDAALLKDGDLVAMGARTFHFLTSSSASGRVDQTPN